MCSADMRRRRLLFRLQRATDDFLHDLRSSAVDSGNAGIDPGARYLVLAHKPITAMQLQELIEQPALHFGAHQLGHCSSLRCEFTSHDQGETLIDERAQHSELRFRIGELEAGVLIVEY